MQLLPSQRKRCVDVYLTVTEEEAFWQHPHKICTFFFPAVYQSVHVFIACRAQIFVLCSIPLSPENSNIFIELTDARPNETEKLLPAGALWSLLT